MEDTVTAVREQFTAKRIHAEYKREDGSISPEYCGVLDQQSGVWIAYGDREKMKATAARWNANPQRVPEKIREKIEAARYLRELLKPGDTLKTILRHVSRSGMMRHISVIHNGEDITWYVARVLEDKRADDGGIKQGGCGMDMGFNLVYNLSRTLFAQGFECSGENCMSNDHFNDRRPQMRRENFKGRMHKNDGGYALKQQWL